MAYEIPRGWTERPREDLIDFFTSAVASQSIREDDEGNAGDAEPQALVGAGLFTSTFYDPSREGLREAAVAAAQGFADFFIPTSDHPPMRHDEATNVDGRTAWRADYSVEPDDPSELPTTVTLIAVDSPSPFYLVAVRSGAGGEMGRTVETILASATIIGVSATASTSG